MFNPVIFCRSMPLYRDALGTLPAEPCAFRHGMRAIRRAGSFRNCLSLLLLACVFSVTSLNAYGLAQAETPLMQISTDKKAYERGDIMIISGTVRQTAERIPITIQILGPDKDLIQIEQVDASKDGTFIIPVKVQGPLWRMSGNYTLIAQNGFKHISSQATFEFDKEIVQHSGTVAVPDKSSGQVFNVSYTIMGGKVNEIVLDQKDLALVVKIEAASKGTISLQMPRQLIDAQDSYGSDDPFIVWIDDSEEISADDAKSDPEYRMLTIPFAEGDSKIEVIGTTVVPEFSGLASIIFSASIVLTLVCFTLAKTRLGSKIYCK